MLGRTSSPRGRKVSRALAGTCVGRTPVGLSLSFSNDRQSGNDKYFVTDMSDKPILQKRQGWSVNLSSGMICNLGLCSGTEGRHKGPLAAVDDASAALVMVLIARQREDGSSSQRTRREMFNVSCSHERCAQASRSMFLTAVCHRMCFGSYRNISPTPSTCEHCSYMGSRQHLTPFIRIRIRSSSEVV